MTIQGLQTELDALGVVLWSDNGMLRYRAPAGVMNEALLSELKHHKAALLELLDSATPDALQPDPSAWYEPFPLTDVQAAYLMGRNPAFTYGGVACHGYLEFKWPALDVPQLEKVWNHLIQRHGMLRAVVHADGYQQILERVPHYAIEVQSVEQRESVRQRLMIRSQSPDQWPLVDWVVTGSGDACHLHLSVDLLVCDYQSIRMLLGELAALYQGSAPAAEPALSFRDYVLAERHQRASAQYQSDQQYWHPLIEHWPGAPDLPVSQAPEPWSPDFDRRHFQLSRADYAQLQQHAADAGIGVSVAVLAAYAEVLRRWSRRDQFCLSLTLLNRQPLHPEVDQLIGDFSAVEVLAIDPTVEQTAEGASMSFAERAKRLQRRLWQDMDHRLFSGVEVLREVGRQHGREAALLPYAYTSTLGARQAHGAESRRSESLLPGTTLVDAMTQTPQVLIDCQVAEQGDALSINWDCRQAAFSQTLLDDMFDSFQALVRSLATHAQCWQQSTVVTLPDAQAARRQAVNQTQDVLPRGGLHQPIWAAAHRAPEAIAVVQGERAYTYGELVKQAQVFAQRLLQTGCQPGERVAICMDKSPDQVAAVLGILCAGAAYLPLDPAQPMARMATILASADVRCVLTDAGSRDLAWPEAFTQCIELENDLALKTSRALKTRTDGRSADAVRQDQPWIPMPLVQPDALAYVIYTSGSTGVPKGVMISHQAALNTVLDINRRFDVTAADRMIGLANLSFDLSVYDIFGVLAAGATLVLPEVDQRNDPSHWALCCRRHHVTLWNSVPAQLQMLLHYLRAEPTAAPETLRLALLSGDWLPLNLPEERDHWLPGLRLISLGGATEAAIWSIAYPIDAVDPHWRSIPYGKPLSNQQCHVLNAALAPCPDGVIGEIYIGGMGLALGYLGDPEKTAERFLVHPETGERLYRTGDLGRYMADGHIEFLGREDFQVKVRGHRIELSEVETALLTHPDVAASAVVAQGASALERHLSAYVQPQSGQDCAWPEGLVESTQAAAHAVSADLSPEAIHEMSAAVERAALLSMGVALKRPGLFEALDQHYSLDEIYHVCDVAPRHQRLIRRWLKVLVNEGLLSWDPKGQTYYGLNVSADDVAALWQTIDVLEPQVGWGREVLRYLKDSQDRLPELMSDQLDPLHLLFPEGRTDVADGAYRRNLINQYLNQAVCAAVRQLAATHANERPLRLLEVGAGVGGTSSDLIPALDGLPVDYYFTDLSHYFLNEAREHFADYPWVRYGLFDLNEDYWAQGVEANSVDVILCANVLHNAQHAAQVLSRLKQILVPGGWLIFIEATRDTYQIMASMEFKEGLTAFDDFRAELDTTFIQRSQWLSLLEDAGAEQTLCLPDANGVHDMDQAMSAIGQHLFIARFKSHQAVLTPAQLQAHLAERLPGYMLPSEYHILDALPVTANGKIDRQALMALTTDQGIQDQVEVEAPRDELEQALAAVWQSTLQRASVGRDQDFFTLGGDSLLVAQLVGRIREQVPVSRLMSWDQLLRQLLNQPTIAALAQVLRPLETSSPQAATLTPTLVPIKTSATGPRRIFVHDGSGTLSPYRALFAELDGHIEGVALPSVEAYLALDPDHAIHQLAAHYAAAIVEAGHRQVSIVGYCLGGLLATELAHSLQDHGVKVDELTVISSYRVPFMIEDDLIAEYVFARVMQADLQALGYPVQESSLETVLSRILVRSPGRIPQDAWRQVEEDEQTHAALEALHALAHKGDEARLAAISQSMRLSDSELSDLDWLRQQLVVLKHSLAAVAQHQATPYEGDMTFIRQSGELQVLPGMHRDMSRYWDQLCQGQLRIVDVPGDHFSCMASPRVSAVAKALVDTQPEVTV